MRIITKGATDQSVTLYIVDNTTGLPATGLAYNSSGIDLWYRREGAAVTSITEATQTASGAHSDGGFVHLANGVYRLDLPDAAVASGVDSVVVGGTVTGYTVYPVTVQLSAFDFQTALQSVNVTQFGGSNGTFSSGRPEVNATHWGGTAVASATPNVNVAQISGDSVAADNAESFFDGTGYAGTNNVIPTVTTTTTATNLTNAPTSGDLTATMKASVNAEVLDVLNTDTFSQPGQGTPAATTTLATMIRYLYKAWRNKKTQTATEYALFNDDATTVDQKATVGESGGTTTIGEIATGP